MAKYSIGLDFGTLSGRALLVNLETGEELSSAVYDYPHAVMDTALPCGKKLKADWALQHPQDYLDVVRITIPQMVSGIVSGAVLSFVSIITEMSSGVILYNNRTITLTISTYSAITGGIYGVAAVFATVTTVFTVICLVVYLKATKMEDVRM